MDTVHRADFSAHEVSVSLLPVAQTRCKVHVSVRLRPVVEDDEKYAQRIRSKPDVCVSLLGDGQSLKIYRDQFYSKTYRVDRTFHPNANQVEVYRNSFKPLVNDAISGYNSTGLVYGQTGSGKSHTMFGAAGTPGLAHLALTDLFEWVKAVDPGGSRDGNGLVSSLDEGSLLYGRGQHMKGSSDSMTVKISISFYQVYIEQAYDLLRGYRTAGDEDAGTGGHRHGDGLSADGDSGHDDLYNYNSYSSSIDIRDRDRTEPFSSVPMHSAYRAGSGEVGGDEIPRAKRPGGRHGPRPLNIREDAKLGLYLENLTLLPVSSPDDAFDVINFGLARRSMRDTGQNSRSSRSHAILQVYVDCGDRISSNRRSMSNVADSAGVPAQGMGGDSTTVSMAHTGHNDGTGSGMGGAAGGMSGFDAHIQSQPAGADMRGQRNFPYVHQYGQFGSMLPGTNSAITAANVVSEGGGGGRGGDGGGVERDPHSSHLGAAGTTLGKNPEYVENREPEPHEHTQQEFEYNVRHADAAAPGVTFRRSILTLVDLAGSERIKQMKSNTKNFKEAVQINKSISALGTCIEALAKNSAEIARYEEEVAHQQLHQHQQYQDASTIGGFGFVANKNSKTRGIAEMKEAFGRVPGSAPAKSGASGAMRMSNYNMRMSGLRGGNGMGFGAGISVGVGVGSSGAGMVGSNPKRTVGPMGHSSFSSAVRSPRGYAAFDRCPEGQNQHLQQHQHQQQQQRSGLSSLSSSVPGSAERSGSRGTRSLRSAILGNGINRTTPASRNHRNTLYTASGLESGTDAASAYSTLTGTTSNATASATVAGIGGVDSTVGRQQQQQQQQIGRHHVPFRDSKLTRLLAEPLSGKVAIITTISPCAFYYEETTSSLKFASRAKVIQKEVRKERVHHLRVVDHSFPAHIDADAGDADALEEPPEPMYFGSHSIEESHSHRTAPLLSSPFRALGPGSRGYGVEGGESEEVSPLHSVDTAHDYPYQHGLRREDLQSHGAPYHHQQQQHSHQQATTSNDSMLSGYSHPSHPHSILEGDDESLSTRGPYTTGNARFSPEGGSRGPSSSAAAGGGGSKGMGPLSVGMLGAEREPEEALKAAKLGPKGFYAERRAQRISTPYMLRGPYDLPSTRPQLFQRPNNLFPQNKTPPPGGQPEAHSPDPHFSPFEGRNPSSGSPPPPPPSSSSAPAFQPQQNQPRELFPTEQNRVLYASPAPQHQQVNQQPSPYHRSLYYPPSSSQLPSQPPAQSHLLPTYLPRQDDGRPSPSSSKLSQYPTQYPPGTYTPGPVSQPTHSPNLSPIPVAPQQRECHYQQQQQGAVYPTSQLQNGPNPMIKEALANHTNFAQQQQQMHIPVPAGERRAPNAATPPDGYYDVSLPESVDNHITASATAASATGLAFLSPQHTHIEQPIGEDTAGMGGKTFSLSDFLKVCTERSQDPHSMDAPGVVPEGTDAATTISDRSAAPPPPPLSLSLFTPLPPPPPAPSLRSGRGDERAQSHLLDGLKEEEEENGDMNDEDCNAAPVDLSAVGLSLSPVVNRGTLRRRFARKAPEGGDTQLQRTPGTKGSGSGGVHNANEEEPTEKKLTDELSRQQRLLSPKYMLSAQSTTHHSHSSRPRLAEKQESGTSVNSQNSCVTYAGVDIGVTVQERDGVRGVILNDEDVAKLRALSPTARRVFTEKIAAIAANESAAAVAGGGGEGNIPSNLSSPTAASSSSGCASVNDLKTISAPSPNPATTTALFSPMPPTSSVAPRVGGHTQGTRSSPAPGPRGPAIAGIAENGGDYPQQQQQQQQDRELREEGGDEVMIGGDDESAASATPNNSASAGGGKPRKRIQHIARSPSFSLRELLRMQKNGNLIGTYDSFSGPSIHFSPYDSLSQDDSAINSEGGVAISRRNSRGSIGRLGRFSFDDFSGANASVNPADLGLTPERDPGSAPERDDSPALHTAFSGKKCSGIARKNSANGVCVGGGNGGNSGVSRDPSVIDNSADDMLAGADFAVRSDLSADSNDDDDATAAAAFASPGKNLPLPLPLSGSKQKSKLAKQGNLKVAFVDFEREVRSALNGANRESMEAHKREGNGDGEEKSASVSVREGGVEGEGEGGRALNGAGTSSADEDALLQYSTSFSTQLGSGESSDSETPTRDSAAAAHNSTGFSGDAAVDIPAVKAASELERRQQQNEQENSMTDPRVNSELDEGRLAESVSLKDGPLAAADVVAEGREDQGFYILPLTPITPLAPSQSADETDDSGNEGPKRVLERSTSMDSATSETAAVALLENKLLQIFAYMEHQNQQLSSLRREIDHKVHDIKRPVAAVPASAGAAVGAGIENLNTHTYLKYLSPLSRSGSFQKSGNFNNATPFESPSAPSSPPPYNAGESIASEIRVEDAQNREKESNGDGVRDGERETEKEADRRPSFAEKQDTLRDMLQKQQSGGQRKPSFSQPAAAAFAFGAAETQNQALVQPQAAEGGVSGEQSKPFARKGSLSQSMLDQIKDRGEKINRSHNKDAAAASPPPPPPPTLLGGFIANNAISVEAAPAGLLGKGARDTPLTGDEEEEREVRDAFPAVPRVGAADMGAETLEGNAPAAQSSRYSSPSSTLAASATGSGSGGRSTGAGAGTGAGLVGVTAAGAWAGAGPPGSAATSRRASPNPPSRRMSYDDFVVELHVKSNADRTHSLAKFKHSKLVSLVVQLEDEIAKKDSEIDTLRDLIMEL